MKILFLSRWFPYPTENGSKLRIYHLLKGLSQHHEVVLISFEDRRPEQNAVDEVRRFCPRLAIVPLKTFRPCSWPALRGLLSLRPRSVVDTHSPAMSSVIGQFLDEERPDVVVASQLGTAIYVDSFRGVPAVFEEIESGVFYDRAKRGGSFPRRFRHRLTWAKHKRYLRGLLRGFQACTVVSEGEAEILRKEILGDVPAPVRVEVVPNAVDVDRYRVLRNENRGDWLIFTGSLSFDPNYAAISWFLKHVYPLILKRLPNLRLIITGDHANRPIAAGPNCLLTGLLEDIRPLLAQARCSIVPLLSGGGTRLKILEAMAAGTPVVSTSKGAEGLDAEHGRHLMIADDPADFAHAVTTLLKDPCLWDTLSRNSLALVRQNYDWSAILPRFLQLLEQTIQSERPTDTVKSAVHAAETV